MAAKNTLVDYTRSFRRNPGSTDVAKSSVGVTANAITSLFTITGKGMIVGGVIRPDVDLDQSNAIVEVYIDDTLHTRLSFDLMNKLNIVPPASNLIRLLILDATNKYFAVDILPNTLFDTKFEVRYDENDGNAQDVFWDVTYTLF